MPGNFDFWLSGLVAADVSLATHATAQGIAQRQRARLSQLLAAVAPASRLVQRALAGRDPQTVPLQALPIARKFELMAGFGDWVTDPALRLDELREFTSARSGIAQPYLGRYTVWQSSGSGGGAPGVFVQDAHALAAYDALEALRRPKARLLDPWYCSERIAYVGAIDGHFAGVVSVRRARQLNPVLAANLHELSFLQPCADLARQLEAINPSIIATYPSTALLLAEEHVAGRLHVRPCEVWTGGETLTAGVRQQVCDAFGCPVVNSYGASEFMALAFECGHGAMHVNSDWVILESVDARGQSVPAGEFGATTLLTNLANRVQPLIRYDLGDRIAIGSAACACGSPMPTIHIDGRADDSVVLRRRGGGNVRVVPLALSTVLEDQAGLFDFQIEQLGPREIRLSTPLTGASANATVHKAQAALVSFLRAQGAADVGVSCCVGRAHRRAPGGKVRRVLGAQTGSHVNTSDERSSA